MEGGDGSPRTNESTLRSSSDRVKFPMFAFPMFACQSGVEAIVRDVRHVRDCCLGLPQVASLLTGPR